MTTTCIGKYSRSHLAERLLHLDGAPFSLKDYPFFYTIYNTDAQETLLKTARQVSKTCVETTACLLESGDTKEISKIQVGERIVSLGVDGATLLSAPVTWKSPRYQKPCVRITTRLGLVLEAGLEHPIRCWDRWVPAGKLTIGTRIASVRQGGRFTGTSRVLTQRSNDDCDTLPSECHSSIHQIHERHSPEYPLTYTKLAKYVEHFRGNEEYNQSLVEELALHLERRDIYWDRVVSIEKIGKQWCYDISVKDTESFVAEGIVTHNSTYCANLMIIDSIRIPHFKTLYLTPTKEQTSKFSNTRLTKTIHYSPHIRKNYIDTTLPNNVLLQVLKNGSLMVLSYAMDDPDRVRGNTSDRNLVDEVQDIHYEAVIPVVKECAAVSKYAYMDYCGTPKSMENTIEYLWGRSSRSEWVMKCEGCSSHQFIDSARSIGKHGVICIKCGKRLNVREGFWYDFAKDTRIKGFHVSQPMLPVNNEYQERWDRILDKLETYSESKFKNEVLGVSDAIGTRFISQDELLAMCHDYCIPESPPLDPEQVEECRFVTGGVDWSGGGSEYVSRTVAWVFGYTGDGRYRTLYYKIFPSDNPIANVEEVAKIFNACRCDIVVGDAGEGAVANSHLMRALGAHRMFQVQYGSFLKLLKWNKKDRYLVDRTAAIDSFMLVLKHQGCIYPNEAQMRLPFLDMLAEYEESTMTGQGGVSRKVWRHAPSTPDDCLHAQVFAWLAMKIAREDLELYDAN